MLSKVNKIVKKVVSAIMEFRIKEEEKCRFNFFESEVFFKKKKKE